MQHLSLTFVTLLRQGDKILLGHRLHPLHMKDQWSCPGGRLEAHEDLMQGALRELREGLGIDIKPEDVEGYRIVQHQWSDKERLYFVTLLKDIGQTPVNNEPDRCSEIARFGLGELPQPLGEHVQVCLDAFTNPEIYSSVGYHPQKNPS